MVFTNEGMGDKRLPGGAMMSFCNHPSSAMRRRFSHRIDPGPPVSPLKKE
jgi:hypothetical protein